MARLNKSQQYAIMWLNGLGKNNEDIAKELSLELNQVDRVLEKAVKPNAENAIPTASEVVKRPSSKDLMIRHTSAKKNNSVAIMTKEASEINDQQKQVNASNPKTQKHIFRPNG